LRLAAGVLSDAYEDLVGIAEIALGKGSLTRAARLLGAEDAYHTAYGSVGWGWTPQQRKQTRQALLATLGEESFRQAWDEGRALATAEAISEALALADELALACD
jgi:hypothetical protein